VEVVDGMKRRRSSSGRKGAYNPAALSASLAKRFPYSEYGRSVHKRGGEMVSRYGPTLAEASAEQAAARRADGWIGRGKYNFARGLLRKGTNALFGMGKKMAPAIASRYGGPLAGQLTSQLLGQGLYQGPMSYSGRGEYSSNSLMSGSDRSEANYQSVGDETGAVIVTHREYLSDVFGPDAGVNFQNTTYSLNPALQSSFPWLSQIAANYDEYEFIQLVYDYRSTTTDIGNSTNGQCGTLIMATNYNAAAAAFQDKQQMMEYAHSMSCKCTDSLTHGVECDPAKVNHKGLYTRGGPLSVNQDIKTYDHGLLQVAVANSPSSYAGFPIGELWVHYSVKLSKPKLWTTRGLDVDRDLVVTPSRDCTVAGVVKATPVIGIKGVTQFKAIQSNIGCLFEGFQHFDVISLLPLNTAKILANLRQFRCEHATIRVTFPASYSGVLAVKMVLTYVGAPNDHPIVPIGFLDDAGYAGMNQLAFQAASGPAATLTCAEAWLQGNVTPVYDIYSANRVPPLPGSVPFGDGIPQFYMASNCTHTAGSAVEYTDVISEFHVNVQSSTGGFDNSIVLPIQDFSMAGSGAGGSACIRISMEVVQYNSFALINKDTNQFVISDTNQIVSGNAV